MDFPSGLPDRHLTGTTFLQVFGLVPPPFHHPPFVVPSLLPPAPDISPSLIALKSRLKIE